MARERLVVVGNGMAGLRFVEELTRRAPERYDVTVVGAEPQPAYNRVLLSALLAGEVGEEECRFRDRRWYLAGGIRLITGAPATAIDRDEREVRIGAHGVLPYDRLVLATGSDPVMLPKPGMTLPGVLAFRTLGDVARMRALPPGSRAVVIGGGLLGIEAAYGLARAGVATTLVHLMERVMERQLDGPAARLVERAMGARGIAIELGADTAAVEGETHATGVRLEDGRVLPADLVVTAVGVRPNAALARAAGLTVNRGIVVDDALATSDARIHALGECAEHRGIAYGLVEPAYEQAAVLARHLTGEPAAYPGSTVATRLKVSGIAVFSAGDIGPGPTGDAVTLSDPGAGRYGKLVFDGARLSGAILVGDTAHAGLLLDLIRTGADVSRHRDDLMFGVPASDALGLARAA